VFHNEFASETELLGYYAGYYDSENLAFSPITEKRFADLLRSFEAYRRQNNILDVGCGSGHFLKVSMEKGWNAHGTEISSSAVDQLSRLGIKSFFGRLESAKYPDEFFDVVYCSEVIEHLLNPIMLLNEIGRIVRRGGLLYVTTPNFNSLSRKVLGSRWRVIGKEHICYFTPKTLSRAARTAGFSKVIVSTRNIDPHELRKAFGRNSSDSGGGFQAGRTEELRRQLEGKRALGLAKTAVNSVLNATGTGDTIVLRAQR